MDTFLQTFFDSGDKPLTLGILAYIVYLLYKANEALTESDKRQTKAIKWLKYHITNIELRVNNLEEFNSRKYPEDWRSPKVIPKTSLTERLELDDD